jgi:hypothetical protein
MKMNFLIKLATGPKNERSPHAQCALSLPRPGHSAEQAEMTWPTTGEAGPC